jgi:hypothetical protein
MKSQRQKRSPILDRHNNHTKELVAGIRINRQVMTVEEKEELIDELNNNKKMITEEINNIEERRERLIAKNDYDEIDDFILGKWQRNKEEIKQITEVMIELSKSVPTV